MYGYIPSCKGFLLGLLSIQNLKPIILTSGQLHAVFESVLYLYLHVESGGLDQPSRRVSGPPHVQKYVTYSAMKMHSSF
jgi:hypothetical protein